MTNSTKTTQKTDIMQRYDTYKDSGVKWLGEIPSHWEVNKAKYLWKESFSVSENGNEELLSVSQYDGITPAKGDSRSESLQGYKIVSENDLVINIMLAWMGGLGVSKYDGIVSPAYCVYKLTNDSNPKYLHYLYKTPLYLAEFARRSSGVIPSRWRMYTDDFGQVVSLLPPRKEQDAIVEYLDEKMAKIDAAIAQQQKMIDLLNERKQIIINRAVTKGLNPNAKMKDSGVEWIGEVPEGWEVRKLKHIAKLQSGDTISSDSFTETGYPVFGGNGFRGYTNRYTNDGDYVLIGRQGALCGNVNYARGQFFASEHAVVVYPYNKENLVWLGEVIRASNLNQYSQSAAQPGLAVSLIQNIFYPYPPKEERDEIALYINNNIKVIEEGIENYQQQISLLQERKQIVINEVVTGKVKVI